MDEKPVKLKNEKEVQLTLSQKKLKTDKIDPRNKLNNLTGKEWIKFLKSWFVFDALHSDLKEEDKISKICKKHPATFSPTLISDFIKFFTKEKMIVLDPFLGIGSTLVACDRTNRIGYGIELNRKFAEAAKKRVSKKQIIIEGDAMNLDKYNIGEVDYCITSPPYLNMLHKVDVNQKIRQNNGLFTKYSDDPRDLGNITDYNIFMGKILTIFDKVYDKMKNGAYLTIIVQNIINKDVMTPFAWDLAIRLSSPPHKFVLKKEKIWCQDHKNLHPFGYPYAWVSNTHHHYCLVFRKE
jgi:DNA modification methylase